jgi:hypothetical protein
MGAAAQVFEYLTTDLKKYMDRSGKGPNFPLPKATIKVGCIAGLVIVMYGFVGWCIERRHGTSGCHKFQDSSK